MATKKTRKITPNTKVKVVNNAGNSVGFTNAEGRHLRFAKQGSFKTVSVEDLETLYADAPAMLIEGILLIEDEDIREHFELDYENIIAYKDIDKLFKEDTEVLKEKLSKTSNSIKKEVAKRAKENSDKLTLSQIEAIEEESKMEVVDKTK